MGEHAAGLPCARDDAGTVAVTTAPAATTEPAPMVTPGAMKACAQIQVLSPTVMGRVTRSKVSRFQACEPVQKKSRRGRRWKSATGR